MSYRIQFDIEEDVMERMRPHIVKDKYRHAFSEKALMQWINREEGRIKNKKDKKEILWERYYLEHGIKKKRNI